MSDDAQEPIIIGEPLEPDEMQDSLTITQQDLDDAVIWWDTVANDLFVGALGE
jgi:hypothetical protein